MKFKTFACAATLTALITTSVPAHANPALVAPAACATGVGCVFVGTVIIGGIVYNVWKNDSGKEFRVRRGTGIFNTNRSINSPSKKKPAKKQPGITWEQAGKLGDFSWIWNGGAEQCEKIAKSKGRKLKQASPAKGGGYYCIFVRN